MNSLSKFVILSCAALVALHFSVPYAGWVLFVALLGASIAPTNE